MLDHLRARQRDLHLLMRGRHPKVRRAGQIRTALTPAIREMRHRVIRIPAPGQVRSRRPGCLPCLRFLPPPADLRRGGVRPGRPSADGSIEEFPLLREASRSSRSTRAARSATCPASRAFSAASSPITRACTAITASRAASSGIRGTNHHDHDMFGPNQAGTLSRLKTSRHAQQSRRK
jgi:hypothetical protein